MSNPQNRGNEPTTEQIETGQWEQPSAVAPGSVIVTVPDGVFERLAQARKLYEELSPAAYRAYRGLSAFSVTGDEFATTGDMSPTAAEVLAVAQASQVFNRIFVYVPRQRYESVMDAVIIGEIDTSGGQTRRFRINQPSAGRWHTENAVSWTESHWWANKYHQFDFTTAVLIAIGILGPILLAVVDNNANWLMLWLVAVMIVPLLVLAAAYLFKVE